MSKNIKCSQCRYLRIGGVYSPTDGGTAFYDCRADLSIKLNKNIANQLRDCPFFRSETKTAWQEVREDIFKIIPDFIREIIGFLKK